GVSGIWKELTDNVNYMASNLTLQVRDISQVATAIAQGNLGQKVTVEVRGELLDLKNTINTMVDQLGSFADEVTRVAREVGVEGKLGGQAEVKGVSGIWKELTDNVNLMGRNLTDQVRDIAEVTTAVANGDLSKKITVEVKGEILALKNTINNMVDSLGSFADEVTRLAREVGTEGVLGGQAVVRGVSGIWKELTDNVNLMARNLTEQVRGIARVVTAVANGDLKQQLMLEARGEIATLVDTINDMLVTLSRFADQVSGVARDVGVEGKLGGQAEVPGAAGIWRDLTNNVNELAGNLTRQVRAIGDVATAVTKGDLTQTIDVEARGEVAVLKDNINQMIQTLAQTTRVNQDQDWLKTNLTRFTRLLQGQRQLLTVARQVLSELAPVVEAQHGVFYMVQSVDDEPVLKLYASYAYMERKHVANQFRFGESLVGQAALERKRILITDVPPDYIQVSSGLGEARPRAIVVVPVLFEEEVKGVIELSSFQKFTPIQLAFLDQLIESLGIVVATIEASSRTDELLRQSQSLAEELQTQQEELQQTNEELEEKARQLTEQKSEVERKNQEVELARQELEEKAEQLALTSRYKSEFLANMSHELRTPLNSLLILSRQLEGNRDGNLTDRQVEYAKTIHQSGTDLLSLINEILDLAKIESGTMAINVSEVPFGKLQDYVDRLFRQVANEKGLTFTIELAADLPQSLRTDEQRLGQVLRNLLSNAFKFTEHGHVKLSIGNVPPVPGQSDSDDPWVAFSVSDTGIGIPKDKQKIIFEAFQQVEGGTSRRFGGTGLGLSISREIAELLGGEITVESEPRRGSTFTLFLPRRYPGPPAVRSIEAPPTRPSRQPSELVDFSDRLLPARGMSHVSPHSPNKSVPDDRKSIAAGDRVLLIIEDDEVFARALLDAARQRGFRGLVALHGEEGLAIAKSFKPDAITLDLRLPDTDGWVILDRLKHDPETRHIPVHIISAMDEERRSLECGAMAFLPKPSEPEALDSALREIEAFLDRQVKKVLIVEDDDVQRNAVVELIDGADVSTTAVATGAEALAALDEEMFDCLIIDLKLPDMAGAELIERLKEKPDLHRLPVIVYTGKELTESDEIGLRRMAESIIVKDVRSPERLLAETMLFLHRVEGDLPEYKRRLLHNRFADGDPALAGKKVLVVDDDVRNIFAITTILEQHRMAVIYAENGREALDKLGDHGDIDIVLMDVMMPEMDGYEATRKIRSQARFARLPVIALTAKAMKGDRDKCIEAGASDYITKPVDPDQLVSLLRVWLYG
ncbi:MAG TPA: response regulator, partial [Haliangium sp.]|nr:response regulator [Haliangium sp.]